MAKGFEDIATEFGHFIEEQHAVVGKGDFAGFGGFSSSNNCGVAGGVVGGSKRASPDEAVGIPRFASRRIDAGDFDGFFKGEGGKNGGETTGEHGFAGTRWTSHEDVMTTGGGDFEGSDGLRLTFHIAEIDGVFVGLTRWLNLEFMRLVKD